jgi:hypothetical protein
MLERADNNSGAIGFMFMYFILSAVGLALLLINLNKKLKSA